MIGIEDRDCGFSEKVDGNGQGEEEEYGNGKLGYPQSAEGQKTALGIKCGSGDQHHLIPPVLRVSPYSAEEFKGEELKRARKSKHMHREVPGTGHGGTHL